MKPIQDTSPSGSTGDTAPTPRKKGRWVRLFLAALVVGVVGIVTFVAVLPTLVGTDLGTRVVTGMVNSNIAGRLEVDSLQLAWGQGQRINGVRLVDPSGQVVVAANRLDIPDFRLSCLLLGEWQIGAFNVDGLEARIEEFEDGSTNLGRSLATSGAGPKPKVKKAPRKGPQDPAKLPGDLDVHVRIRDGKITFTAPDVETIECEINAELDVPSPREAVFRLDVNVRQGDLSGQIVSRLDASGLVKNNGQIAWATATAKGTTTLSSVPVELLDRLAGADGRLSTLIGEVVEARVEGHGGVAGYNAQLSMDSKRLRSRIGVRFSDDRFELTQGSGVWWDLNPDGWVLLSDWLGLRTGVNLADAASVALTAERVESGDEGLNGRMLVSVSDLDLEVESNGSDLIPVKVTETRGAINFDGSKREIATDLQAGVVHDEQTGLIALSATINGEIDSDGRVDLNDWRARAEATVTQLPVALVDTLAGTRGWVAATIGSDLEVAISVDAEPASEQLAVLNSRKYGDGADVVQASLRAGRDSEVVDKTEGLAVAGTFSVKVSTPRVESQVNGEFSPSGVSLQPGATLRFTVRPELVDQLVAQVKAWPAGMRHLGLAEPMELGLELTSFELALPAEDWKSTRVGLRTVIDKIVPKGESRLEGASIRGLSLVMPETDFSGPVSVQAEGTVGHGDGTSTVRADATTDELFVEGRRAAHGSVTVESLAVALVDRWLSEQAQLSGLIGPEATVQMQGRYREQDPVELEMTVSGTHAQADVAVAIGDELALLRDAQLSLDVTPELSESWLKRVHPLLNEAAQSAEPVRLTIESESLRVPIEAFDLQEVEALASVDLGVVQFKDDGLMNRLRRAFQRDTTVAPQASFTPLSLSLRGGVLEYSDMTMTMDNLIMGFRGRIDQASERVELVMAISGQTLDKAFGLGDVIEPGYELELPIRGTISQPDVDFGAVGLEVARLGAKSQIKGKLKGPEGEAAGAIIDLILGGDKQQNQAQSDHEHQETMPEADGTDEPAPDVEANDEAQQEPATPTAEPPSDDPLGDLFRLIEKERQEKKERKREKKKRKKKKKQQDD